MGRSKKLEKSPPRGIRYTQQEQDRALRDVIYIAANMLRSGEEPRAVGTAVTSAIHRAVELSRGSVRAAADTVGLAPSTFADQRNLGLMDVCHYLSMHDPLDDNLFPFIRIQWQTSTLAFVESCLAWLESDIQPRAHQEQTQIVLLQNFSPFSGPVTDEFVDALTTGVQSRGDLSVVRGIVMLAPSMPDLGARLGVVNEGNDLDQDGLVRFTTDSAAALGHAVQLFSQTSVSTIPPLHLE